MWEKFKTHAERVIALTNILAVVVMICLVWITYNGIKSSNQAVERSNTLLEQQIRIQNRAFVSIEPKGWRPIITVNRDKGTRAFLILTNYGNKPARELKVIKDCMIRLMAPMDKDKFPEFEKDINIVAPPDAELDPKREDRLTRYYEYREKPVKELSDYLKNTPLVDLVDMKNKEIEEHFREKWKNSGYNLEVYNPTLSDNFAPRIVYPQQPLLVKVSPSTGLDHEPFVKDGGYIIVVFLVVEYHGMSEQKEDVYCSCCISLYDSLFLPKKKEEESLYPLVLYTSWEIDHWGLVG